MTVFDIEEEKGYTRKLLAEGVPPTPWFVKTGKGLSTADISFTQIILSDRGFLPLNPLSFDEFGIRTNFDEILEKLPEWSILTPRLYPAADNLTDSLTYEMNLYLDRLDTTVFPKAFGLVFDLIHGDEDLLSQLLSYKPSILVLRHPNIEDESPRKVLAKIKEIRDLVPPNIALYLPGSGGIGYQTLMIVLGIDLIDDLAAYRFAARKRGFVDGQIHYLPDWSINDLIRNNLKQIHNDFDHIIFHLNRNTLWSKFDKDMHVDPHVASFRHLLAHDPQFSLDLSRFEKFSRNNLNFIGEEGLYHPDVLGYQHRISERYVEKSWVKVVVLLPCSARKPYRESYSHQKYEKAIHEGAKEKRNLVTVWSLTSPLGVVPRDLETVYPAQHYDIPVTGNWTHEEIRRTGELLGSMLKQLDPSVKVIAHVSADYVPMIQVAEEYVNINKSWMNSGSRSENALHELSSQIGKELEPFDPVDLGKKGAYIEARNTIQAITKFNHGSAVELDFDYESIRVIGRPPRPLAIQKNKQHWITWDKLGGDVRLHQLAAMDIAKDTENWVLVTADRLRGSNLFGVGVGEASESISPGDEVIFFNEDKSILLGLGVATVSGRTMNRVKSGQVATIRKKFILEMGELRA